MHRRDFLRLGALGLAGCGGRAGSGGLDAAVGRDGDALCRPTRGDALGPFFEEGAPMRSRIAGDDEPGERLRLSVRIVESDCTTPIPGVLVDIWQADENGSYHGAGEEYRLRGRVLTDGDGAFEIETIRPGHYENGPGNWRPAHLHLLFAKDGFASFPTQIYFEGDPYLHPNDGCPGCGSDDPDRIVSLRGDAAAGWDGSLEIVLAHS